jgi:cytochrome c
MRCLMVMLALAAVPVVARAEGDAAAGQRVFNQCRACHTVNEGGRNGVGPNLFNIVDRPAGSIEGFRYSANLRELGAEGLVWNEDRLRAYVANPKAVVPRGSMTYVGLRNETQINDLMAYLATLR